MNIENRATVGKGRPGTLGQAERISVCVAVGRRRRTRRPERFQLRRILKTHSRSLYHDLEFNIFDSRCPFKNILCVIEAFRCGRNRTLCVSSGRHQHRNQDARNKKCLHRDPLGHSFESSAPSTHFTRSISPGRQVLSIHACSGPYILKATNQPLPGMVSSQLFS